MNRGEFEKLERAAREAKVRIEFFLTWGKVMDLEAAGEIIEDAVRNYQREAADDAVPGTGV